MASILGIPSKNQHQQNRANMRLQGRLLLVVRISWIAVITLTLVLFFASLPATFAVLRTVCNGDSCTALQPASQDVQWLHDHGLSTSFLAIYWIVLAVITTIIWSLVGIIIFWHRPNDWMALLAAFWLVIFGCAFINNENYSALATQLTNPIWNFLAQFLLMLGFLSFAAFFYLFPDGNLLKSHTRWFFVVWIALNGGAFYYVNYFGNIVFQFNVVNIYLMFFTITTVIYQVYHYHSLENVSQRRQFKWLVFAISIELLVISLLFLIYAIFPVVSQNTLYFLAYVTATDFFALLMPLSIGIAIFRSRLFDIDIIINRTVVYGVLTVSIVGFYIVLVGMLNNFFQAFVPHSNLFILVPGTGLIAFLIHPLWHYLQRAANRLMYGEAGNPYVVLSRLGKRLGTTLAPDEVLPVIVETVAHSLKLPHVAITLRQDGAFKTVASHGSSGKSLMHLPLVYQTETIGELVLASHVPEPFTKRELQLLHELARQAGVAIHTVLLTAELERSRQHIVESREQARRTLGNDLHDKVAPTFTALMRKVEMVSTSLEQDLTVTHQQLEEIKQQVKEANRDIRHLAHQLHSPELQHYGLVQALREHIQVYDQPHPGGLYITMEAPQELLSLSIAVESATYYIALAALNNVDRHARAHTCHLRLELIHNEKSVHPIPGVWNTAVLELEINDDGCGLLTEEEKSMPGLGLLSMQERAVELGGTCVVETKVTGGTRVYACLPCIPNDCA